MEGVTTAIVLFVFVCILFPRLIDNRPQYYMAFACTLLIILGSAVATLLGPSDAARFVILGVAILQVAAVLLLFLSAGGLTARGLTKEMAGAFEVMRRGETTREVIIPIGGQKDAPTRRRAVETKNEPPERINLDAEASGGAAYPARKPAAPPAPVRKDEDDDGPIPFE